MTDQSTQISVTHFEDLLDCIQKFGSLCINDRVYPDSYIVRLLTINSVRLDDEASTCASHLVEWGVISSQARRMKAQVDAAYRTWRDRKYFELKGTTLEETGKAPSDSQVDRLTRTDPDYQKWQSRLIGAQESAELAEAVQEALRVKASMIRVQSQLFRDEAGGPYYVVEEAKQAVPRTPQIGGLK